MLRPRLWSPLMQGSVDQHMLAACLCHPEESLACFGEQRSSHSRRAAQFAERAPSPFAPSAVLASGQACHLQTCWTVVKVDCLNSPSRLADHLVSQFFAKIASFLALFRNLVRQNTRTTRVPGLARFGIVMITKMRGESRKQIARKSRNSCTIYSRSCGCIGTVDSGPKCAHSWNQI